MKEIIKLFFIFCISISFSQTGKVIYKLESLKTDNLDHHMIKGIIEEWKQINCELNYNSTNSYFRAKNSIPIDEKYNRLSKVFSETYTVWYQDLKNKDAIFNKEIKGEMYQVKLDRLKGWQITDEIKVIEGYTCYKAVRKELNETGRAPKGSYMVHIAWFTPDIPAPFGPIGNGGLPGLILRLERPNLVAFTAKKIILNNSDNIKIKKPTKGIQITMKERSRLMRKARLVTPD